jgi:glycosyltransferase involved in cell wall biosynthesis
MASTSAGSAGWQHSSSALQEIRVAWLFPSLARGYYWQPVFKRFVAHCPKTAIFTSIWPGFSPGYEGTFEVHTLPGLRYIDIRKQVRDSRRGFIWTPLAILKKLAAFQPDVLFSSGFSGWTVSALLCKFVRGSRVIIYWEGCSAQSVGSSRLKLTMRRWIGRLADAAITNGEEGAIYLRDIVGIPQEKVVCHPCQVPDLSLLASVASEANLPHLKRPVFLYVGGISPRKGWNYLVEAAHQLVSRGIGQFSVVLIGSGEQKEELRAAIKERQLESVVHQVGEVAYHNLGYYFRDADVFVSPTRADTWGVAVLEAMAFGKPVLCSRFAGTRQMVTPGENGFIFDPFDPAELADYMAKFIRDQSLAARLGVRSLEKMVGYTPYRAAEVLADVALETIERKRRHMHSESSRQTSSGGVRQVKT